ncbi:MAG: hypothetical protein HUK00_05945 [Bacteroidaceae bacterium]|nr:hypothetical protein [Bacteroidaceae bacterium]
MKKVLFSFLMTLSLVANCQSWLPFTSMVFFNNIQSELYCQKIENVNSTTIVTLSKEIGSKYYLEGVSCNGVTSHRIPIAIDSIYDITVLNDTIYFSGWHANTGIIGRLNINSLFNNIGFYEIMPIGVYKIHKLKSYLSFGHTHIVGIGRANVDLFDRRFFDFSNKYNSNFALASVVINNNLRLLDIDLTDKFIAISGNMTTSSNTKMVVCSSNKIDPMNISLYEYDNAINVANLFTNPYDERMLITHTQQNQIVVSVSAFNNSNDPVVLTNCIDLQSPMTINNVREIRHDKKNIVLRDAVFNKQANTLLIVEDCALNSTPINRSYIIHNKPYSIGNQIEDCWYDKQNNTRFNTICNLQIGKYIALGVGTEDVVSNIYFMKTLTTNTPCCASKFQYTSYNLQQIYGTSIPNICSPTLSYSNWNQVTLLANDGIFIQCNY